MTATMDGIAEIPRFTREDCERIQEYAKYGSNLPGRLPAVEIFVGYKTAGVAGLEPAELLSLFLDVRKNAGEWDGIDIQLSQQMKMLASIATKVVCSGESLIAAIKAMPFYVRIRATIGSDLVDLPSNGVPDESFGRDDIEKKSTLLRQLEGLRKVNLEKVEESEGAVRSLTGFRREIEALEPLVAAKRMAIRNSNLEKIGNETTVEPMIAVLQLEYDRAVVTSGHNAAIVEAKRKVLDQAIQTLKSQMDVYRDRQRVTYTMGRLFVHFTELKMVMIDAEMAVGHLWLAAKETAAALESSSAGFAEINSSRKLVNFLTDLQIQIGNWKMVQNRATELNRVF